MNEEQENILINLLNPIDINSILKDCEQATSDIDEIVDEVGVKTFGDGPDDYEIDRKSADKSASSAIKLVDDISSEVSSLLHKNYEQAQNIYSAFFNLDDCQVSFPFNKWFPMYKIDAASVMNLTYDCSYNKSLQVLSNATTIASRYYNDIKGQYETNSLFLIDFINTLFNNYELVTDEEFNKNLNDNKSNNTQNNWLKKLSKKVIVNDSNTDRGDNFFLKSQKDLFITISNLTAPDVRPDTFLYFIMAISYNNPLLLEELEKKLQDKYFFNAVSKFTVELLKKIPLSPKDRGDDTRDLFLHSFLFDVRKLGISTGFLGHEKTNNLFSIEAQIKSAPRYSIFEPQTNKYVANLFALKNISLVDGKRFPIVSSICDLIIDEFLNQCAKKDMFFNSSIAVEIDAQHQKAKLEKTICVAIPGNLIHKIKV